MPITQTLPRTTHANGSAQTQLYIVRQRQPKIERDERSSSSAGAVTPADCQAKRDYTIEAWAIAELRNSAYAPVRQVLCEVQDCVLTLRGRVPSFYLKQIAQTVVRHPLEGSLVIDNQLEVDQT